MKLKNRAHLISVLKDQGFAGPFTIEGVKAYCSDPANGIEIPDKDLDTVWAKTIKAEAEVEDKSADDAETKMAELEARTKAAELEAKVARGSKTVVDKGYSAASGAGRESDLALSAKAMRNISARKAYDARAARGEARCQSADHAELVVAQACLQAMGERDYPQKRTHLEIIQKTGLEGSNPLGGATVPEEFTPELLYATEPYGVARRTANLVPMKEHTKKQPRKTGIAAFSHSGEAATLTGTQNTFGGVDLTAKKVTCLVIASSEWVEDSAISVADDLANTFAEARGIREDQDYFAGNGTSTYGGHVGLAKGLPSGAYLSAASATWASQTIGAIHNAVGSVENCNTNRLSWRCSRQWFFQVPFRLGIAQAYGSASGVQITAGQINSASGWTILGAPVEFVQTGMAITGGTQYNSTTGNYTGVCAAFGDFVGASMLGTRRELNVRFSEHRYMDTDSMAWLATTRFAVNWHGDGRGGTFGPVVAIVNP